MDENWFILSILYFLKYFTFFYKVYKLVNNTIKQKITIRVLQL